MKDDNLRHLINRLTRHQLAILFALNTLGPTRSYELHSLCGYWMSLNLHRDLDKLTGLGLIEGRIDDVKVGGAKLKSRIVWLKGDAQ